MSAAHEPILPQEERLDRRALVQPPDVQARIEQGLVHLRKRERPAHPLRYAALGFAAAAAALLVLWRVLPAPEPQVSTWSGTELKTTHEPVKLKLADGSSLSAAPQTELTFEETGSGLAQEGAGGTHTKRRFVLRRGKATFDVAHRAQSKIVVQVGPITVDIIDTHVQVERVVAAYSEQVTVQVLRGSVKVRQGDRVRELGAGQRWSVTESHEVVEIEAPAEEAAAKEPPPARQPRRAVRRRRARSRASHPPAASAEESDPVSALFELASEARRAGQWNEAAKLYEQLLRDHPEDGRAGLTAFELGRLRMDKLGQRRQAADALRRALRLSSSSPFREDAMARLVRVFDALNDAPACDEAKAAYLAAYPGGRYAEALSHRCEANR